MASNTQRRVNKDNERKYVRELASDEDLDEIQKLIDERREKLDY